MGLESRKWSVVELKTTYAELEELVGWLASTTQDDIYEAYDRGWSKAIDPSGQFTNKVVVGLLLHVISAETVRRFGSEGSYWSCVYNQLPWKEINQKQLFSYNGQPSTFHKELLQDSAQALQLRHTFGIDGVQQWFSTGFLQFGFTHHGFKRRLGEWLAGYHMSTNAIESLTNYGDLESQSFTELWGSLERYRNNQLPDDVLENRIKDSCWILPEWIHDLRVAAKDKLHLGTKSGRQVDSEGTTEFLSKPILKFDNFGHPQFRFRLIDIIELPLTAESYTVTLNDEPKLDLIRQNDGAYDPIGSEEFLVPWNENIVHVAVKDRRTGEQVALQDVDIWQPDEFLHVFAENGQKYEDAYAMKSKPGNAIHILFPSLLVYKIEGTENSIWTSDDGTWKILTLSPDTNLKLLLDGEIFWELRESLEPSNELVKGREFIYNNINVQVSPVDVQSGLLLSTIEVKTHESVTIKRARIGFETLAFDEATHKAILPAKAEYLQQGFSIQFSVEAFGQKLTIRKRVSIPYTGAFWIRHDGVNYDVPRVLHTQDTSNMKLCAFPRNARDGDDPDSYCITEGYHFTRRLAKHAIQLAGLHGLGSPLMLQKGLFNQFDEPQVLAHAVIDGGCIHQIKICEEYLTIFPSNFLPLKGDFVAVAWVGSKEEMRLENLALNEDTVSNTEHRVWRAQNNFGNEYINAIGIFYKGECIGSWWNLSHWTLAIKACTTRELAEEYSNVIRNFNCPILYDETRDYLVRFLRKFPAEVLVSWLHPKSELNFENKRLRTSGQKYDRWIRAVGILFEEAMPEIDLADISLIIEELSSSENSVSLDSITNVTHRLTGASPTLTSSVVGSWLKDYEIVDKEKAKYIKEALIETLEPSEEELDDIATNIIRGTDCEFINKICSAFGRNGVNLHEKQKVNLPFLFEHSITRRLAAAQSLKHH